MADLVEAFKNDSPKELTNEDTLKTDVSDSDDHNRGRQRKRKKGRRKRSRSRSKSNTGSSSPLSQRGADEDMFDSSSGREKRFTVEERKKEEKLNIFSETQKLLVEEVFVCALKFGTFDHGFGIGGVNRDEQRVGETESDISSERRDFKMNHEIWNTDIPEKMLLRKNPISAVPEDSDELGREAEWIYKHGFTQHNFTRYRCGNWQGKIVTVKAIAKVCSNSSKHVH